MGEKLFALCQLLRSNNGALVPKEQEVALSRPLDNKTDEECSSVSFGNTWNQEEGNRFISYSEGIRIKRRQEKRSPLRSEATRRDPG